MEGTQPHPSAPAAAAGPVAASGPAKASAVLGPHQERQLPADRVSPAAAAAGPAGILQGLGSKCCLNLDCTDADHQAVSRNRHIGMQFWRVHAAAVHLAAAAAAVYPAAARHTSHQVKQACSRLLFCLEHL